MARGIRSLPVTAVLALLYLSLQCVHCRPAACPLTSPTVLSALLPLHSGPDCTTLQLRGLQQLAALRAAVNEVNGELKAQDGLSIGLLVQDTCGTVEGAVGAALRTLVEAQQSCADPPLYLGMIGPEDPEALVRVRGVTRVFNTSHVLSAPRGEVRETEDHGVFYVSSERQQDQAQGVLALLRKLQWRSFSLTFEEPLAGAAEALASAVREDQTLCVRGLTRLGPQGPTPSIFGGTVGGAVVLTASQQAAARVLRLYRGLSTPLVLLVQDVGLETWQVPRSASKLYLLQLVSATTEGVPEAINVTLKTEYENQRQNEFQNVHCRVPENAADCALESSVQDNLLDNTDVSVGGLAAGVRLVSAALRSAHRARCLSGVTPVYGACPRLKAMPSSEWWSALRRANANHRPHPPSHLHIFSRDNDEGHLVKIGSLVSGSLKASAEYTWPVLQPVSDTSACGNSESVPPLPPPVTGRPAPPPAQDDSFFTLRDLYTSEYSFYELIGMICAVGFIMFGVMVVIIYVIYNSLVEKAEKESTGGSVETVRPRRRSLRDTFRRNSVARSSNRS